MIASRWKAALAALFLFVAGIAVGVLGTVGIGLRQIRLTFREPAVMQGRGERAIDRMHSRIVKELDLDTAQSAHVRAELERTAAELSTVRSENRQRIRRLLAGTALRIGADLPPEKRTELRRLMVQRLSRLGIERTGDPASGEAPESN